MVTGGHSCGHEHDACDGHNHISPEAQSAQDWSLYQDVDTTRLTCLNEASPNSLQRVLRPWDQRTDRDLPVLSSETDQELLMCIPFTSPVHIRSICIIGPGDVENPSHMKAFINKDTMDFSSASSTKALQQFDLIQSNNEGQLEYPTKYTHFQNVSKLWLYVDFNYGGDVTKIQYIGLKGVSTNYKREAVKAEYETRPIPGESSEVKGQNGAPEIMGESTWDVK